MKAITDKLQVLMTPKQYAMGYSKEQKIMTKTPCRRRGNSQTIPPLSFKISLGSNTSAEGECPRN